MRSIQKLASGHGNIAVCDSEKPVAERDFVIVEVKAAGICGTDIHIYLGEYKTNAPVIIGHEFAGVIAEVGPEATGWQVGDRVTSRTFYSTCGTCRYCLGGTPNLCLQRASIGTHVNGAFARYIRVPAGNLHRLPDELDFQEGALTEPLACCVRGVSELASIKPGDVVLITGPGAIGLLSLQLAKNAGGTVIVLGTTQDAYRLEVAKQIGADYVFDVLAEQEQIAATVNRLTAGNGCDVAIECSGAAPAAQAALGYMRKGGHYCQIGLFGKPIQLDADLICFKEITVTGSFATVPSSWERALRLLADRKIEVKPLISHVFPLEQWEDALRCAMDKKGIKIVLIP